MGLTSFINFGNSTVRQPCTKNLLRISSTPPLKPSLPQPGSGPGFKQHESGKLLPTKTFRQSLYPVPCPRVLSPPPQQDREVCKASQFSATEVEVWYCKKNHDANEVKFVIDFPPTKYLLFQIGIYLQ